MPTALDLLTRGAIEVKGRMPASSNVTLLVDCTLGKDSALAVYKPRKGERRLWDFPPGLWKREVAAYLLSEALGWGLVPLTVPREGPHGEGSLQLFIHADFEQHYFTLLDDAAHHDALRRICLFDLLTNNADRKSGHCLLGPEGQIFAIDNGLTFNADEKLRTVIWDFAGEPIPPSVCADLHRLSEELRGDTGQRLEPLLDRFELDAVRARVAQLLRTGEYPDADRDYHSYPWPTI